MCLVYTQSPWVPRVTTTQWEGWCYVVAHWQYSVSLHCPIDWRWNYQDLLSAGWCYGSSNKHVYDTFGWCNYMQTESFIKQFGFQDLLFLSAQFFLWCAMKNSFYLNNPHTIDDLNIAITEYILIYIEHSLWEQIWHVKKCLEPWKTLWTLLVTMWSW